jgi:hypothetical protein
MPSPRRSPETRTRTRTVVRGIRPDTAGEGRLTAIVEAARETKQEATEMMETYLEGEDEALDGFEFLTMAEAGEVGHWAIVKKFNERAGIASVTELTEWALPVQEEHLSVVSRARSISPGAKTPTRSPSSGLTPSAETRSCSRFPTRWCACTRSSSGGGRRRHARPSRDPTRSSARWKACSPLRAISIAIRRTS